MRMEESGVLGIEGQRGVAYMLDGDERWVERAWETRPFAGQVLYRDWK